MLFEQNKTAHGLLLISLSKLSVFILISLGDNPSCKLLKPGSEPSALTRASV